MKLAPNGMPRRITLELCSPAEKAIRRAMESVENAGGGPLLTDAVVLLSEALDKVGDFVDSQIDDDTPKTEGANMKPSIGRIVHYYPQQHDRFGETGEPIAAVIVRVCSDECVNLRLLPDSHDSPYVTSVLHDAERGPFSWSWPPRV